MKIGIYQMNVMKNKKDTLEKLKNFFDQSFEEKTDFILLPEMFNCPYDNTYFREYSENEKNGETLKLLSELSAKYKTYIIGGSVPENDGGKIYNTSFVFDRNGKIIAKHRKIHLFDINIPEIRFMESDVLSPGNNITIFDTEFGKFGVIICYDIRFPELSRIMALEGVKGIFVPAAFNTVTGPAHWDILFRSRAIDNQIFMFGASPARDENFSYNAYGHSLIVNPWGKIIAEFDKKEQFGFFDINLDEINFYREKMPYYNHRRTDIYNIKRKLC
ncbi:MAG TPA: carbon-nitrogen hydrolase family protein [Tepiditoga sp.]|nr:carbon-nitrogen hydrolase family protein [Tepiditoga sp.]